MVIQIPFTKQSVLVVRITHCIPFVCGPIRNDANYLYVICVVLYFYGLLITELGETPKSVEWLLLLEFGVGVDGLPLDPVGPVSPVAPL